jgi:hypothetical protein
VRLTLFIYSFMYSFTYLFILGLFENAIAQSIQRRMRMISEHRM